MRYEQAFSRVKLKRTRLLSRKHDQEEQKGRTSKSLANRPAGRRTRKVLKDAWLVSGRSWLAGIATIATDNRRLQARMLTPSYDDSREAEPCQAKPHQSWIHKDWSRTWPGGATPPSDFKFGSRDDARLISKPMGRNGGDVGSDDMRCGSHAESIGCEPASIFSCRNSVLATSVGNGLSSKANIAVTSLCRRRDPRSKHEKRRYQSSKHG